MTIKRYSCLLILFLFLFIFLFPTAYIASVQAQENLRINTIFTKYGKQKGSTTVMLSGSALHNYKLDKYHSITIQYNKSILDEIQKCLEADKNQARQIKEVINNGIISSGYYQLPEESNRIKKYILFKIGTDGTATLIYMEGGQDSEELIDRLFIKKE